MSRAVTTLIRYMGIGLVSGAAWATKHHYSAASADELRWVLAPTAVLVGLVTGERMPFESGAGYVSADRAVVIAKGCAGVNFMILAFVLLAIPRLCRQTRAGGTALCVGVAAPLAYGITVIVNAARIVGAINLYRMPIYNEFLTAERMHHLAGTAVYFSSLWVLYALAAPRPKRPSPSYPDDEHRGIRLCRRWSAGRWNAAVPLLWYGSVMLVIPVVRGALLADPAQVAEHALFVTLCPLAIVLLALTAKTGAKRLWSIGRIPGSRPVRG
jgi:exosortase K